MGAMDRFTAPDGTVMGLKVPPQPATPTPTPTPAPVPPQGTFPLNEDARIAEGIDPIPSDAPWWLQLFWKGVRGQYGVNDGASPPPAATPAATPDPYTGGYGGGSPSATPAATPDPYTGGYGGGSSSADATNAFYGASGQTPKPSYGGIGSDYGATQGMGSAETSSGGSSSGKTVADTMYSGAGGGMGYPAAGIGPLAWATGAPTVGQANQALAGVFNEQKQQPARIGGWGAAYNNPGNLEKGGWTSTQPGFQPAAPGRFATFDTMQHGLDALQANLHAYAARGINTPAGIAKPWAPPFENNTAQYGGVLANAAGVPNVNTPLNMNDPWTYNRLASGVGQIEMGVSPSKIANAIYGAPQGQVYSDASNATLANYGVGGVPPIAKQQW